MARIIRINKCYNCDYRDQIFDSNKKAVWLCNKRGRRQISDVMAEPPLWCPLEHTDGGEDITQLKQACEQYKRKIKSLEQAIADMNAGVIE